VVILLLLLLFLLTRGLLSRWDPLLNMLSSGLLPLLGRPLMAGMRKVARV
jgi:hypothetical protein